MWCASDNFCLECWSAVCVLCSVQSCTNVSQQGMTDICHHQAHALNIILQWYVLCYVSIKLFRNAQCIYPLTANAVQDENETTTTKKKYCNFVTLPAQAHVMKIHSEFELFSSFFSFAHTSSSSLGEQLRKKTKIYALERHRLHATIKWKSIALCTVGGQLKMSCRWCRYRCRCFINVIRSPIFITNRVQLI